MAATTYKQNSEFLLGLLLEENKYMNMIDFIDRQDPATNYACVCISLAIGQQYHVLRDVFTNVDDFLPLYFTIYASALENYRSIVGHNLRQIFVDEAKIFYPEELLVSVSNKLVSDPFNKATAMSLLDVVKNKHSYMIILRDEIAFIVIHHENDNYIVIDPHVEYCGILSKDGIYKYVVYDGIWDFDVNVLLKNTTVDQNSITQPNEV